MSQNSDQIQKTNCCKNCGSEAEMLTEDMNAPKRCALCGSEKKNTNEGVVK